MKNLVDAQHAPSPFHHAINQMALVSECDPEGKITHANENFIKKSKYSLEELRGNDHRLLNSGKHSKEFFAKLWQKISHGENWQGTLCNKNKLGELFWVNMLIYPQKNDSGEILGFLSISIDITHQVLTEETLKNERVKTTRISHLANLGELTVGIAHELNNPLSIIRGRVRSLHHLLSHQEIKKGDIEEVAEKIDNTVRRISSIIDGLKGFSRHAEATPMKTTTLGKLIEDTFEYCKKKIENAGIELRLSNLQPELTIQCRATLTPQVLLNLLQNSHDAIANSESPWIELTSWQSGNLTYLSVTDSGPGIPPEERLKLFEKFYTTKESGTGLGLNLSQKIMEQNKGHLRIDSDSPNTRFIMSFLSGSRNTDISRKNIDHTIS